MCCDSQNPGERIPEERLLIGLFLHSEFIMICFLNLLNETLLETITNSSLLFSSFPFPLFFLSNKPKLFSLLFRYPFNFLYFSQNLIFLSSPFYSILFSHSHFSLLHTNPNSLPFHFPFSDLSHFNFLLSFFISLILTWYFLFHFSHFNLIFPLSFDILLLQWNHFSLFCFHFPFSFSSNQPKLFSFSFHFSFN